MTQILVSFWFNSGLKPAFTVKFRLNLNDIGVT